MPIKWLTELLKNRWAVVVILTCLILVDIGIITITIAFKSETFKSQIIKDLMGVQKLSLTTEAEFKAEFMQKTALGRQVYQWSFYKIVNTKAGDLNLNKYYAMNLKEFNMLMEKSWEFNRLLSMPVDSWKNYVPFAKWILESAVYLYANHKTGEVIKMTGYTREGYVQALFHYKYDLNIVPGHPLYIKDLDNNRTMSDDDVSRIFYNIDNVVKFDYAYLWWLCRQYDYKWDWVLTAFHFGPDKTIYWWDAGCKEIPNFRLDGKWSDYYLREYNQAVIEIAQALSEGRAERISRFEEYVEHIAKAQSEMNNYIMTLKLKARSEDKARDLEETVLKMRLDFSNYKRANEDLWKQTAVLNELVLDNKKNQGPIRVLKNTIIQKFKELRNGK